MLFKEDITRRIIVDFGDNSSEVKVLLTKAIEEVSDLKTDRIIRCILFLSKGNINSLKKYIEAAAGDPRDVMLWAEYEDLKDGFNYKRLRDFNLTFEKSTINIEE